MREYVVVINNRNDHATIHERACSHLGSQPADLVSENARRLSFDDGLDALLAAKDAEQTNVWFCGHCLKKYRRLLAN